MSAGFYKRRRGVVEHIEAATIDLLENGIHDYLSLRANLVIGNGSSIPAGVCFTSAPALRHYCRRWVRSDRTMQRILERMEQIGWIKTWPKNRGNYPTLICRATVHDLSGNEYRVNGEKTTDWRHPVYEPVGELSPNCPEVVRKLAGLREVRDESKEGRRKSAAKPAPPADPRFQAFFSYAYESYRAKHQRAPIWTGKDKNALKNLLRGQNAEALPLDRLKALWEHFVASTEAFTLRQGDSLAYFCSNLDKFSDGPILAALGKGTNGKPDINEAVATTMRGFAANSGIPN